ncbi:hypothetical protein [Novosphingobium jiangmenense]|uniref:YCII-related domain-containing protein n=1 Tax=Novosphingobium jiangmenense TaxID=2791981 RepID=A0ABS0HF22_9SPHN|nr:hypothetical protein [Novosphingobium jiangmenense]MBF9150576.1 hypothetical protein [Novosphingobium jiangmenense]
MRRRAVAVKIHCPIASQTLAALLKGDNDALERDPAAGAILAVIRDDNPLGDFGLYKGVCEIAPGWESFQPGPDATPTLGTSGARSLSSTAILTTYAYAGADIAEALAALMAAHPWEVPVIELSEVELLVR